MAVTYKDAMNFINSEIEHFEAVIRIDTDPVTIGAYRRNIEILRVIKDVITGCNDEFDPEVRKFYLTAIRDIKFCKSFVVEASDEYEAKEKLEDSFDCGQFYMDESTMDPCDSSFWIDDVSIYEGNASSYEEIVDGIWEV